MFTRRSSLLRLLPLGSELGGGHASLQFSSFPNREFTGYLRKLTPLFSRDFRLHLCLV
jgi:hypothetical protein